MTRARCQGIGETRAELAAEYKKMAEDGILPDDAETCDDLMKRCDELQKRANA